MDINALRNNPYRNGSPPRRNYPVPSPDDSLRVTCVLLVSGLTIFCLAGYYLLVHWPFFIADRIVVSGNIRLGDSQVVEQAGVRKGDNILSLNLQLVRKRLKAHPWIADAEVRRLLPRGIHIRIKEHRPVAIFDMGHRFIVNIQGEIFKEWKADDPRYLPVIEGLTLGDAGIAGAPRSSAFNAVMNVLKFGMNPKSVMPNRIIRHIRVDREMGIGLHAVWETGDIRVQEIKLGFDQYSIKYERLEAILNHLKKDRNYLNIESIDLNNPDRVVVNPIRTESLAGDFKEV